MTRNRAETKESGSRAKTPEKNRIAFIDIGRGLGALLVFYSHIAHPWVVAKGEHAPYVNFIEALTSDPMHMSVQGIGQIAVPFFFLVSGFVVTPIAVKQGYRRFALNRGIRVYAPMLFVVLLTALMLVTNLHPPSTGQSQELTPLTMLTNATLVNYLIVPQVVLVPVAWTMIIEIIFYLLLMAILPVLRRWVWLAILLELTFIFVVIMSRSQLGDSYALFAVNVSYLPTMMIGQIIWATTTQKIPLWTGGLYGAIAWSLYVLADIVGMGRLDSSYNLSLAVAVLFFMMGYFAEPKLRQWRFWTAMSERSYSLYLLHMLVSFVVLQLLRPFLPFPIAAVIAIAAVFGTVELSYRYVERPSHALARRLSHRPGPNPNPRSSPKPKPNPKPKPSPRSDAEPARKPDPKPETRPERKPDLRSERKPEVRSEREPDPEPDREPKARQRPTTGPVLGPNPVPKRNPRPDAKPGSGDEEATAEIPKARGRRVADAEQTVITRAVGRHRAVGRINGQLSGQLDVPQPVRRVTPKR